MAETESKKIKLGKISQKYFRALNRVAVDNALNSIFSDFEDSVLHESARHAGAQYIITRNIRKLKIPVYTPTKFLSMLESLG